MAILNLVSAVVTPPRIPVGTLIDRARSVFAPAGLDVKEQVRQDISGTAPHLARPWVGRCDGNMTPDLEALFDLSPSPEVGVVIMFVGGMRLGFLGCATHPNGVAGAVVAAIAGEWTLAHELGHLLGLAHRSQPPTSLMVPSTARLPASPFVPTLSEDEAATMLASDLTLRSRGETSELERTP